MPHHNHSSRLKFKTNLSSLIRKKSAKENRDLTQDIIAQEIGLGQATVSRWIRGDLLEIDADTLQLWAFYFGCSPRDVIDLSPVQTGESQ